MHNNWGKLISGKMFLEEDFVIHNGEIKLIDNFEGKDEFGIKKIEYEAFPGIEKGYYYRNYWESTENGIIQKWKKEKIPKDPSIRLQVEMNNFNYAVETIFETIDVLLEDNKKKLELFYKEDMMIEQIYKRASSIFGEGKVCSDFCKKQYNVKQFIEEIGYQKLFTQKNIRYNEKYDCYYDKEREKIITYPYLKNSFYNIDTFLTFTTVGNKNYLKMSYIYLYTLLDEFILHAIEVVAILDLRTIIRYVNTIQSKDVIECLQYNDLKEKMIAHLIYLMGWKSFEEKIDFFRNAGIQIIQDKNHKYLEDEITVIGEKRNIIVHNRGIVNQDFLKKVQGKSITDNFKIGEEVNLDIDMLRKDSQKMKLYAESIYLAIKNKYTLLPYKLNQDKI